METPNFVDPDILADPYPVYRRLRRETPVFWHPLYHAWILTRHADVEPLLQDPDIGLIDPSQMSTPPADLPAEAAAKLAAIDEFLSQWLVCLTGPPHARLRLLVNHGFKPHLVARLEPRIQQIADDLLDAVAAAGETEFVRDFAYPLPILVIGELLGMPASDRRLVTSWSQEMLPFLQSGDKSVPAIEAMDRVIAEMKAYLRETFEERRRNPREDVLGHLVTAHDQGEILSEEELLATCHLLIFAGHETTVNLLGNGLLALLRHPDQLRKLRADPSLTADAVNELLRYESPVQFTSRLSPGALEIGGQRLEKGQNILLCLGAANRDPERFADPDRLDITRKSHALLAFGQGIHTCLGAPLARLEARIAFDTLLRRASGLHPVHATVAWKPNLNLRGPRELPIRFAEMRSKS